MNEEQIINIVKETFDKVADGYDGQALRFFLKGAEHLCDHLDLHVHEHVLDVATGTGNAAITIAKRLPEGRVTGVDFSGGMLDRARNKASRLGLGNVDFRQMDMRALEFPADHFDVAVCSFGIFFVSAMDDQLLRIVNAVKSGGRVAITSFSEDQFQPLRQMMLARLADYGVTQSPQAWERVATKSRCLALFKRANLKNPKVLLKNVGYYLRGADDWWDVVWNAGFRRLVDQLSADDQARFKREHLREVEALRTAHGIWLNAPVLFTVGTKS